MAGSAGAVVTPLTCTSAGVGYIQTVNYIETTVEWEQWTVADSDSE